MTATLDPSTTDGARALERLASEKIGWLTTVDPAGQPQASAIWFLWDAGEILIHSGRRAPRNGNLADDPRVVFNLHTDAGGGDYVSMEGTARLDPGGTPVPSQNGPYLAKCAAMMAGYDWTAAYVDVEYPVVVPTTGTSPDAAPIGGRI